MNTSSELQQTVLQRFVAACESDTRVVAAFLGGSFATGKADEQSDLDIYIITTDEAYDDFFAGRLAYSYDEQPRRKCVNLAHLAHDFTAEPAGYAKVEQDVPEEQLLALQSTFCPLEPRAMLEAMRVLVSIYRQIARPLAAKYEIDY